MDSLRLSSKTSYGGTVALDGFSCVSKTYLTVEMACGNQDCFFESVAKQKIIEGEYCLLGQIINLLSYDRPLGLYLQQHQTD
jgi:hypothetical protein